MRGSVDVHNHLLERGVPHEVFRAQGSLRGAGRIAAVLGLPASQVGKVVVYDSESGPLAVVVAFDREPDPDLVAKRAGVPAVQPTDSSRASELTGFFAEAVPPAGLPAEITVLLDEPLQQEEVLYFLAGESDTLLKIRGEDLASGTGALVGTLTA